MDFWLGTAYLALAQAHFADRDFAAAKDMGSRALALKPSSLRGAIVAASCAHLDEAEEAARRLKELKAIGSDFLASLLDGSYTLYRNPGHNALLVDGLRTAESPRGDVEAPPSEALPLPDKPSIAVLPFNNMSGDQEQDYFSDGITEDIIRGARRALCARRQHPTGRQPGQNHGAAHRQRNRQTRLGRTIRQELGGYFRAPGGDHG
jgi:hypothetical protein